MLVAHGVGVIGLDRSDSRHADPALFDGARRFHGGGLVAGEVPVIARHGEGVFTPGRMRALGLTIAGRSEVTVAVNVDNNAIGAEARADWRREAAGGFTLDIVIDQVEGRLAPNIGRGEGLAPTVERRYGLNPAAAAYTDKGLQRWVIGQRRPITRRRGETR